MRAELGLKLLCSECGEALEASTNQNDLPRSADHAYNWNVYMKIKPCPSCIDIATKDAKMIAHAIKNLHSQ